MFTTIGDELHCRYLTLPCSIERTTIISLQGSDTQAVTWLRAAAVSQIHHRDRTGLTSPEV